MVTLRAAESITTTCEGMSAVLMPFVAQTQYKYCRVVCRMQSNIVEGYSGHVLEFDRRCRGKTSGYELCVK